MDALGDLVARDRRSPDPAIRDDAAERTVSYRDCVGTANKVGNFLRYRGVDAGDTVAVAPEAARQPVLTLLGAALLGAPVRFAVPTADAPFDARVVVVPASSATDGTDRGGDPDGGFDLSPGATLVAYGDPPGSPGVDHWERNVWSENPAFPPTPVDPDGPVLLAGDDAGAGSRARALTHREVLGRAERVAEENGLDGETAVVVRDGLADPGVVVAGVFAPLLAGGTVVFPGPETVGDLAVVSAAGAGDATTEPVPESRVIDAASVLD